MSDELDLIVLTDLYATGDVRQLIEAVRTARAQRNDAEYRAANWRTVATCLIVFLIGVVGTASVTMGWWR